MVRETKRRKVAVLGYFFHNNFGDELILDGLRQLFMDWQVIPMNEKSFNINVVNKCDLFVLGGGELIHGDRLFMNTPSFFGFKIPRLAHRLMNRTNINNISWVHNIKVPKVILGCGVNVENVSELKKEVVSELEQFDYIGLRDQTSVELLKSISTLKNRVHLFYDLAFSLNYNPTNRTKSNEKIAVVIPTDRFTFSDKGVQQNQIANKSRDWLQQKLVGFDKTIFIPFGQEDNDDYATCQSLANGVTNSEVVSPENLSFQTIIDYIVSSETVFPYRLHGLILSFILEKRYEFYLYHRKLSKVHETIKKMVPDEVRCNQQKEFKSMLHTVYVER